MIALSPDGYHYLRAAMGRAVPRPYNRRWLLPRLLGPDPCHWALCTYASLLLTPAAAWLYFGAMGLAGGELTFATLLLSSLPAVRACSLRFPVLLDAPSFVLALLLAWCTKATPWWCTIVLALIGGATRETVPIFAALWAWSPLPLVGLVAAGWSRRTAPPDLEREPHLGAPFRSALALRRQFGADGSLYLRPWGAALAGLAAPSWQLAATIAVAHAQLFVAVDTVRLAVWCAPVVVLAAVKVIPAAWWPLAIVVTTVHREERT